MTISSIQSTPPGKTINLLLNEDILLANIKVSPYFVIERNTNQGQVALQQLLGMIQVNLSDPKAKCVFLYRWFWKDEKNLDNVEVWGIVETTTEWAILLCQDAINYNYLQIWASGGYDVNQAPQLTLNGVFDCETSQATLLPAQIIRANGVGDVDHWPMGKEEFTWCMQYSIPLGALIEDSWTKAGLDIAQAYNFLNPNYAIVVENETKKDSFIAAPVPSSCKGNNITDIVGTKLTDTLDTTKEKASNVNWPLVAGIVVGGTVVVVLVGGALLTLTGWAVRDVIKDRYQND